MDAGAELTLDFNPESIELVPDNSILIEQQYQEGDVEIPISGVGNQAAVAESGVAAGGNPEQYDPYPGMEFDSLESARKFYFDYAERLGFRVRNSRFRTSRRDDSIIMRRFVCYKEGFHLKKERRKNDGKERRKRASIREGCKAMFEVVRKDEDMWVVSKLITEHTHVFASSIKARKAKKKGEVPVFPLDMSSMFREGLGAEIRPDVFWGGGEAFNLLEYFKKMQKKNPMFFYSIQVDENNHLVNVFWADARARMAYSYFGDVIALDTTYKKNKLMLPFVLFTGVNHHLQPVVFGCGILLDEMEPSYVWLFDTFLVAMCGQHPVSLVTDHSDALGLAAAKVFPDTRHRICKWRILSKCKEKLPNLCSTLAARATFKEELKKCIDASETVEDFESAWEALLIKYNLRENVWLQSLYEVRQQWATVYLKDVFFAEMSPAQRSESMNKFFQRNFETKTSLREFITKFDQAMAGQYEKEVQADFAHIFTGSVLKTASAIEKQASETYTKTIFTIFQEEFVQSSTYSADMIHHDGLVCTYRVALEGEDAHRTHNVNFSASEKTASCSCQKFEFSGIACRHMLCVFSVSGVHKLPEHLFLKRWTQKAKSGAVLYESGAKLQRNTQNAFAPRYNDICLDVLKYAAEGATSLVIYKAAKDALRKAFAEVVSAKKSMWSTEAGISNARLPSRLKGPH